MTSPFLEDGKTQYAWDSTSLGWLKTCPRLYQYSMLEGWRSKQPSVHLQFGIWYHSALEAYDHKRAEGLDHDSALNLVVHQVLIDSWPWPFDNAAGPPSVAAKTRENLVRSVIWYLDYFQNDTAQTIRLANGKPAVELSFRMELDWGPAAGQPYMLCGHLDRVVTYADNIYIMDRKTTSSSPSAYYFDKYSPDNQMSLYSLAAKVVYKVTLKGVIIDVAQIMVGFTRFARGFAYRSDAQLTEWLEDTRRWLKLAEQYAQEGVWPQNDKACDMYGGCAFRRVCCKSPEMRRAFLESDFKREPWNPLDIRG
jgi:hypothetical protein